MKTRLVVLPEQSEFIALRGCVVGQLSSEPKIDKQEVVRRAGSRSQVCDVRYFVFCLCHKARSQPLDDRVEKDVGPCRTTMIRGAIGRSDRDRIKLAQFKANTQDVRLLPLVAMAVGGGNNGAVR